MATGHLIKRYALGLAAVLLVGLGSEAAAQPGMAGETSAWTTSWAAAMQPSPIPANSFLAFSSQAPVLTNQTVRQMVQLTAGGKRLRVRFSNVFGRQPLVLHAASVGRQSGKGAGVLQASSLRMLHFDGRTSVTIAPGTSRYSDPIDLAVRAGDTLGISLHVAGKVAPTSWNQDASRINFVSTQGNYTASPVMPVGMTIGSIVWLSGVEVEPTAPTPAIVVLGDSITRGFRSTVGAHRRYTDVLARRLREVPGGNCRFAVLNAGIDGNQVSAFGGTYGLGQSMLKRFDRDVLAQHGVRFVLLLGGINDIGETTMAAHGRPIDGKAIAGHVIEAQRQIIDKAHAAGLQIIGATLTPFGGTLGAYSAQGEVARQRVNRWIRHRAHYDAMVDFDAVMRDPSQPARLRPELDSSDHIHPNDEGYRVMAAAIPPTLFGCR